MRSTLTVTVGDAALDELVITKMRVGPPERNGMLVSLSIGDPVTPISAETISMTVRIPMDVMDTPETIQAQALKRCADVIGKQLTEISRQGLGVTAGNGNIIYLRTMIPQT